MRKCRMLGEMFGNDDVPAESDAQQRADALSEFYLPVTPEAGRLLYALVRASRPTTVVEFGMSLGISAIHLASAVRDNGEGRVVTTELKLDEGRGGHQQLRRCRAGRRDHRAAR